MNVKTLILGVVIGGMIAAGTYFFVPTPSGAYAQGNCATTWDLMDAVTQINAHTTNTAIIWSD